MGDVDEQCRTDCHDQCKKISKPRSLFHVNLLCDVNFCIL